MRKHHDIALIQQLVQQAELAAAFGPEVSARMELHIYEDREVVCTMGDRLDGLYVQIKGRLKVYTQLPNGKTMLLRFSRSPALIGDVEWLGQYPVKNNVEAVGEAWLLFVSREAILSHQADNPTFLWFMIQNLSHKLYAFGNAMASNLLYPVENRFASFLLSLQATEGWRGEQAEEIRTSTLTETAELLGTSYRHLSRVINQFVSEGVLGRKRGRLVILDERKLKELAGGHSYI